MDRFGGTQERTFPASFCPAWQCLAIFRCAFIHILGQSCGSQGSALRMPQKWRACFLFCFLLRALRRSSASIIHITLSIVTLCHNQMNPDTYFEIKVLKYQMHLFQRHEKIKIDGKDAAAPEWKQSISRWRETYTCTKEWLPTWRFVKRDLLWPDSSCLQLSFTSND